MINSKYLQNNFAYFVFYSQEFVHALWDLICLKATLPVNGWAMSIAVQCLATLVMYRCIITCIDLYNAYKVYWTLAYTAS